VLMAQAVVVVTGAMVCPHPLLAPL